MGPAAGWGIWGMWLRWDPSSQREPEVPGSQEKSNPALFGPWFQHVPCRVITTKQRWSLQILKEWQETRWIPRALVSCGNRGGRCWSSRWRGGLRRNLKRICSKLTELKLKKTVQLSESDSGFHQIGLNLLHSELWEREDNFKEINELYFLYKNNIKRQVSLYSECAFFIHFSWGSDRSLACKFFKWDMKAMNT